MGVCAASDGDVTFARDPRVDYEKGGESSLCPVLLFVSKVILTLSFQERIIEKLRELVFQCDQTTKACSSHYFKVRHLFVCWRKNNGYFSLEG